MMFHKIILKANVEVLLQAKHENAIISLETVKPHKECMIISMFDNHTKFELGWITKICIFRFLQIFDIVVTLKHGQITKSQMYWSCLMRTTTTQKLDIYYIYNVKTTTITATGRWADH